MLEFDRTDMGEVGTRECVAGIVRYPRSFSRSRSELYMSGEDWRSRPLDGGRRGTAGRAWWGSR